MARCRRPGFVFRSGLQMFDIAPRPARAGRGELLYSIAIGIRTDVGVKQGIRRGAVIVRPSVVAAIAAEAAIARIAMAVVVMDATDTEATAASETTHALTAHHPAVKTTASAVTKAAATATHRGRRGYRCGSDGRQS
jgi:hypothetical protein